MTVVMILVSWAWQGLCNLDVGVKYMLVLMFV